MHLRFISIVFIHCNWQRLEDLAACMHVCMLCTVLSAADVLPIRSSHQIASEGNHGIRCDGIDNWQELNKIEDLIHGIHDIK